MNKPFVEDDDDDEKESGESDVDEHLSTDTADFSHWPILVDGVLGGHYVLCVVPGHYQQIRQSKTDEALAEGLLGQIPVEHAHKHDVHVA